MTRKKLKKESEKKAREKALLLKKRLQQEEDCRRRLKQEEKKRQNKNAAIKIQKNVRGIKVKKRYDLKKKSIIILQKSIRGHLNRKQYQISLEKNKKMEKLINDINNNAADLSIIIGDQQVWGKGVGSRAWMASLKILIETLGFRVVTAGTMEVNEPMVKLMKASGMQIQGIIPRRFLWEGFEVGMVVASISK